MTLTAAQLQQVVERVIARLQARQQQTARLSVADLREADMANLLHDHAALTLTQVDSVFLARLAAGDDSDPAVAQLCTALAVGVRVSVCVHHRLLAVLAVNLLSQLALNVVDENGWPVHLCRASVLSYRHLASLSRGWLLVPPGTLITPLAREIAVSRGITLVKQE